MYLHQRRRLRDRPHHPQGRRLLWGDGPHAQRASARQLHRRGGGHLFRAEPGQLHAHSGGHGQDHADLGAADAHPNPQVGSIVGHAHGRRAHSGGELDARAVLQPWGNGDPGRRERGALLHHQRRRSGGVQGGNRNHAPLQSGVLRGARADQRGAPQGHHQGGRGGGVLGSRKRRLHEAAAPVRRPHLRRGNAQPRNLDRWQRESCHRHPF
mmetsp:Transcript_69365/g.136405  ORF Transcript_69365/g.136405 Transcript_69365/m.136405 type:complete len:211 (+) Transcript_69365:712-1344(+)